MLWKIKYLTIFILLSCNSYGDLAGKVFTEVTVQQAVTIPENARNILSPDLQLKYNLH